ncbi:hypothetical protein SUGI_0943190 [Cryptomeria japonica]|nr:hypothetical protein SUGI_0943190 [Cryptomeria japonica]
MESVVNRPFLQWRKQWGDSSSSLRLKCFNVWSHALSFSGLSRELFSAAGPGFDSRESRWRKAFFLAFCNGLWIGPGFKHRPQLWRLIRLFVTFFSLFGVVFLGAENLRTGFHVG